MDLRFLGFKKLLDAEKIINKKILGFFFGTVLILSLLVSKAPFGFNGLTGIDLLSLAKLTIVGIISFYLVRKNNYLYLIPFIFSIIFFMAWKTSKLEYYFIYFEIIYLFICSYYIINYRINYSLILTLLILILIMLPMHLFGLTFAPENTGPGKYIIYGSTTAVRVYGVCLFLCLSFLIYNKNRSLSIIYSILIGYFTYTILITVSKIGWIACIITTLIIFFITLKYKKLYNAYICLIIAFIASYSNGYFDILTDRFIQSSSVNIFQAKYNEGPPLNQKIIEFQSTKGNVHKNYDELKDEGNKNLHPMFDRLMKLDRTGRIEMHQNSILLFLERPLFGYIFSDTQDKLIFFSKPNGHPHNVILEVVLRFGIFGLALYFFILYKVLSYSFSDNQVFNSLIIISTIYFFILSLTNGDIIDNKFIFLMPLLIKNIYNGSSK